MQSLEASKGLASAVAGWLFVLSQLAAPSTTAAPQAIAGAASPPRVVARLPLSAFEPHPDERGFEWESWDYVFSFPGGFRLLAQLQLTNAGPGRRHGLVSAVIVAPDGSARLLRNSRPRGQWGREALPDQVRLTLHSHVFAMGPSRHELRLQNRMGRFEVTAVPAAPAVDLGRVSGPDGSAYELVVLASRLRASATVQLPGQGALELRDGWGVATRSRSTVPAHRQMLASAALHTFDPPAQLSLLTLAPPRGEAFCWLLLVREPGSVEVARAVERRWSGAMREDETPRYLTPRRLELRTADGFSAEAGFRLRPLARYDVLGWIRNPLVRWVTGRVTHPVQYVFEAEYGAHVGRQEQAIAASGRGVLLLSILGQPRAEWP